MRAHCWVVGWALLGGCGSDGSPDPGVVQLDAARTSIDLMAKLPAAVTAMDGAAAALTVEELMVSGSDIVHPFAGAPQWGVISAAAVTFDAGTADCRVDGCTYDHYVGSSGVYNSSALTGTVSAGGDHASFDLTIEQSDRLSQTTWATDGSLTVTPRAMHGSVHLVGNGTFRSGLGRVGAWTSDVTTHYDDIVLNATGCPTAGTARTRTHYDFTVPPGSDEEETHFDIEGTADFGLSCAAD